MIASCTNSKSSQVRMYEVAAIPMPPKAKPIRVAAGRASTAQNDCTKPNAAITTRKATAYMRPRSRAHATSPTATSPTAIGVARMAS